jgi:hypothetical protein
MAVSIFSLVGSSFRRIQRHLCLWSSGIKNVGGVIIMLKHLMYPKVGFWILHAIAIVLMFLLGYSVHFK